ncbi:MAG: LysE/ArgO family amino acid transporter [Desulfosarcinaceae bacterium]|nr:LysE/ArgO family amino acid transporter [Desulfosarcinaceae bacterium]
MNLTPFVHGFGTGGGLIVAIGAQNAHVLSQGVRDNHPLTVALICIACDIVFVSAGIAGVGAAVSASPALTLWATWGGAAFLLFYGWGSLRSALRGGTLDVSERSDRSLKRVVVTTLAVTLLNPHFYLDTVILLGGLSSRFQGESRFSFWAGAITASILWFLTLSLGGRLLAFLFARPIAWRILDTLVCATMWSIAGTLVWHLIAK